MSSLDEPTGHVPYKTWASCTVWHGGVWRQIFIAYLLLHWYCSTFTAWRLGISNAKCDGDFQIPGFWSKWCWVRFRNLFLLFSMNFHSFFSSLKSVTVSNAAKFSNVHTFNINTKRHNQILLKCIRNSLPSSMESEVLLLSKERYSFLFKSRAFDGTLLNRFSEVSRGLFLTCFSFGESSFPNP